VEFRDGTTVVGQDTIAPYSFTRKNVAGGNPRAHRARDRQRRRCDDEQRSDDHGQEEALSEPGG
jgi:hypothetical protein